MTNRNASRLEAGLIARKGQAAPAQTRTHPLSGSAEPSIGSSNGDGAEPRSAGPLARGIQGTIAVTVRLDPDRYERMKVHGARRRRTNQDILVEALDRYFASLPE